MNDTMVIRPGLTGTATHQDGEKAMHLRGQDDEYNPIDLTLKDTALRVMLKLLEDKKDD